MILAVFDNLASVIFLGSAVALAILGIGFIGMSFWCEDCKAHDEVQSEPVQGRPFDWQRD